MTKKGKQLPYQLAPVVVLLALTVPRTTLAARAGEVSGRILFELSIEELMEIPIDPLGPVQCNRQDNRSYAEARPCHSDADDTSACRGIVPSATSKIRDALGHGR
jgi:hypothetical protein